MSATHPSDTALFDCAARPEPAVLAHVRDCAACAARYDRLSAGASLIETAADPSARSGVDWRAIDSAVLAAAAQTAADIRKGALRPARRMPSLAHVGAALAAAAVGVMVLRARVEAPRAPDDAPPSLAMPAPSPPRETAPGRAATPTTAAAEAPAPVEGVVLMLVAPVTYAEAGAPALLRGDTPVRQGGRLAVDTHGGRAVVAMHAGARLDARAGAELELAQLSTAETRVALRAGQARLDGPAQGDAHAALEAGGWTLTAARGGAFVASVERDAVRVRVVAGELAAARAVGADAPRAFRAGDEVLLAKTGGAVRVVGRGARDADAIDTAYLSPTARALAVPALPAGRGAAVLVRGHGALPAGLSVLRASEAVTLRAQVGRDAFALALDPAREGPAAWRRAGATDPSASAAVPVAAHATPTATAAGQLVASATTVTASSTATATVPAPPPSTAPAAPIAAPAPAVAPAPVAMHGYQWPARGAGTADEVRRHLHADLQDRVAACFDACERNSSCGRWPSGSVRVSINAQGRTVGANIDHRIGAAPQVEACIEQQARQIRTPSWVPAATYYVEFQR